ncbi:MAG: carbohydrate ABC transporter substrate-binding protein [Oscillospiraceae bacterium]
MKKLISLVLATALLATTLTACGGDPKPAPDAAATPDASAAPAQTVKVAAIESAYGTEGWTKVIAAFEKQTGIKVEFIIDKNLEDVIGAGMKAGDYPDVVMLALGRKAALTETMIKDKALTDLTDVLSMTVPGETKKVSEKIIPGFTDSTATNPYGDGKMYMAPMFYSPCGLFYDSNLLKTKGWELPTTWDEMWALGDKAKAEGIALFAYPHSGYFDALFYGLCKSVGGQEFLDKVTTYQEGVWDTEEGKQVIEVITKLASYTEKSVPANGNNDNFQKNQQLILDDKAIFMPNGTWVVGEMKDAKRAEGFTWGFAPLPAAKKGGAQCSYTFLEQMWVPAQAANIDAAKQFVAFMYSDEAAKLFASTEVPAVQPMTGLAANLTGDNKMFYSIYDNGAMGAMGSFATTEPVEGVSVADAAFAAVDSLVNGTKKADDYKAGLVKAFDALRPALKK